MRPTMKPLAWSYLDAQDRVIEAEKRAARIRLKLVQLLQEIDAEYMFDEEGRQSALETAQHNLYIVILAKQLSEKAEHKGSSPKSLVSEAESLLDKTRNANMIESPPSHMRTPNEERMYIALRVRWRELIRLAGIRGMRSGPRR